MSELDLGWYVISEPKYRIPNVFNLHRSGRFNGEPFITKRVGARIVAQDSYHVAVEYRYLVDTSGVHNGKRYTHMTQQGRIVLSSDFAIDVSRIDRTVGDQEGTKEILSVYKSWSEDWLPKTMEGKVDFKTTRNKITDAIYEAKKTLYSELKKRNERWINARLPATRQGMNRWPDNIIVFEDLEDAYKKLGGVDDTSGLMRKISQFCTICYTTEPEGLERLDGNMWENEGEMWDCWSAFAGDETEAKKVCKAMDQVFAPLVNKRVKVNVNTTVTP